MKATVIKNGVTYYRKNCQGGCGEWYYTYAERRCPVCGCGLVMTAKGKAKARAALAKAGVL